MRGAATAVSALVAMVFACTTNAYAQATVLDDFEKIAGWTTNPSDGTSMRITPDAGHEGQGMRLDFAFTGGGYASARKAIRVSLPDNYELSFYLRGEAPSENLEFKLVDASGENVWWVNRRDVVFSKTWQRVVIKKRQVSFAWGPKGGGEIRDVASIEIVVTAGSGGRGTIWIDDLQLTPKDPVLRDLPAPVASATSHASNADASAALDHDSTTAWRPAAADRSAALTLDFSAPREFGGLTLDWTRGMQAADYDVELSDDAKQWTTAYRMRASDGSRDYVYLPESESRYLRVRVRRAASVRGVALRELAVQPIAFGASRNAFYEAVARDAPAGDYPKYFSGKQSYWTILGVNGDDAEALMNEQGAIEVDKRGFTLEPFVRDGKTLVTWADVQTTPSLLDGDLPIPSVEWKADSLSLTTTAFTEGSPGASVLHARYRVENRGAAARTVTLYVALRPFQVNPPAQFLNTPGGAATIGELAFDGKSVAVNGGEKRVVAITKPDAFGAATFDAGGIVTPMRDGVLPVARRVVDSTGGASGAFAWKIALKANESRDVFVAVPFHATTPTPLLTLDPVHAAAIGTARLDASRREWADALHRVEIVLPKAGERVVETLRANLAYMLITRDGMALKPGARSYDRSWIRDGAMMSAALLRLGRPYEAKSYAEWYAQYQYASGKVPCCVDARGADPVPENDSHGELIYLAAEVWRFTHDRKFLEAMWPHVVMAVTYMDTLRQQRLTPEYASGDKRVFHGLLPQSISHEGYSAKPMHSYWDQLFALKGYKDAVEIATALDKKATAATWTKTRDEFRRDLMASYKLSMQQHKIDYLPGSAELGDFDATSTTIALNPVGEQANLPEPALTRTFEKYYENFKARRDGKLDWKDYTPYELRVVGTMVRLGRRDRAHELLDFFFKDQRPAAWRDWGEVVHRDPTATKFVGDMPHAWVGSDYVRSVMDMFAYERESDSSLVVGAGIPPAWVNDDPGVEVRKLPTYYGPLDLSMRAEDRRVRVSLSGVRVPPGGIVLRSPLDRTLTSATIDGTQTPVRGGREIVVRRLPATIVLTHD